MPLTKEPKPLPTPLDYAPKHGVQYRVGNADSWWTLAEKPGAKEARMSPNDLCYFNFKTRNPEEINWYLYHKVGCRMSTRDGKNFRFSGADRPGIVYLPDIGHHPPPHELPPRTNAPRMNAWLGIVVKAGTMFAVVGIETMGGYAASLDDLGKGMAITASINRLGVGWGASGGASFIFITGVEKPTDLNGYQQLDKDFNLALGPKWSAMASASSKVKKLEPLIKVLLKIGAKTPSGLKAALHAEPDRWVELVKAGKSVKDYSEINPKGLPNVFVFDVPFAGGGTEASAFYGLSNFQALWDFAD